MTNVGVWIDHKKAVVVSMVADKIAITTLLSDVPPHPHYAGSQEDGGEKKYEERHDLRLDRFYDRVIRQIGDAAALLIFGPGEAKLQLRERIGQSRTLPERTVIVESADKMTDPQILTKVKEHYQAALRR